MGKVYKLGLDIGSTTIKVVLLDGEKIIHSDYQRHHSGCKCNYNIREYEYLCEYDRHFRLRFRRTFRC